MNLDRWNQTGDIWTFADDPAFRIERDPDTLAWLTYQHDTQVNERGTLEQAAALVEQGHDEQADFTAAISGLTPQEIAAYVVQHMQPIPPLKRVDNNRKRRRKKEPKSKKSEQAKNRI